VSGERFEIALVVQRARITHAKSVATLPDGEIDDLDHLGRTLDQAIADAVLDTIATLTDDLALLGGAVRRHRAEVERLRAAIDAFVTEVDDHHTPEWASEQAKAKGKEPWCCEWCGPQDGGWPCVHRMTLDQLKEARRER
jgi:hypothetical protein